MTSIKTSISLPEPVFAAIEACAEKENVSRSTIVREAVEEYLRRKAAAELSDQMNAALAETPQLDAEDEAFLRAAWRQQSKGHKDDRW
jgi:metal-responsive CopG/Arc/MetJ family transcriptional regulator